MCGIAGFVGSTSAAPVVLRCLKRLEYRGYDSAGIATLDSALHVVKDRGSVTLLETRIGALSGNAGIGHTRWATHGEPSARNAHPHVDCSGSIAVVHNGIIENHAELRKMLEARGHAFASETDSEVIAHLVEEGMKGSDVKSALRGALQLLRGSYALALLSTREAGVIYVARHESPLVIGGGSGGFFFASDIPALLGDAERFYALDDGEIGVMRESGISVERNGERVEKKPLKVDWSEEMAQKGGYAHFTLKEIFEQPLAVHDTIAQDVSEAARYAKRFARVHAIGCGSSYHAALLFAHAMRGAGVHCEACIASEYRYSHAALADGNTLLLAISQSGETADVLVAVREAKRNGARVLAMSNVLGSTLAREADAVLYTRAGPEISVVATKTFAAQVALLSRLAAAISGRDDSAHALPDLLEDSLHGFDAAARRIAQQLHALGHFFFIGRGVSHATALEGALKLKEISYAHAEGYAAGELKHGPLSLLDGSVVVVAIAPGDHALEKMRSNIRECKTRGARILALSNDERVLAEADWAIRVPDVAPQLSPVLYGAPLQLLAYYIAVAKGNDPDRPRNLAKSVTVE